MKQGTYRSCSTLGLNLDAERTMSAAAKPEDFVLPKRKVLVARYSSLTVPRQVSALRQDATVQ